MDLDAAMQGVVDELRAGGVRAVMDARDANPPCVLLRPPTIHFRFGKPTYTADFEAWAMVPDTGQSSSLVAAGDLVTAVSEALGGRIETATPDDATLADGGTVPIYRLTWTQRIPA